MNPGSGVLSGRRILIVEDEAVISLMLEDLLTESGCVAIGPTGTTMAALALIEHEAIDCAILDVKLTDGMPAPVAEALAARGIRFVIATGCTHEAIDPAYSGAPVLSKAFLLDELIDAIADILRP